MLNIILKYTRPQKYCILKNLIFHRHYIENIILEYPYYDKNIIETYCVKYELLIDCAHNV